MAISCSGFNTIALFSRRIIKIDNALVNASLVFWFCFAEMICSVTWNYPMGDKQIFDWRANILIQLERSVRTQAYGLLKKGPRRWKRFLVASASIALRFLCPRPLYYLSAPNQNRHTTQATDLGARESLNGWKKYGIEKYSRHFLARLDFPSPPSQLLPLSGSPRMSSCLLSMGMDMLFGRGHQ